MTEIFRHYRPTVFDKERVEIRPAKNGGISYLLRPTEMGKYNFWLYICPFDAEFSAKQSVKTLREVANQNIMPWGEIEIFQDSPPLIDLLIAASTQTDLPSEVGAMVTKIYRHNKCNEVRLKHRTYHTVVNLYKEEDGHI